MPNAHETVPTSRSADSDSARRSTSSGSTKSTRSSAAGRDVGSRAFEQAGLTPDDIDVAQLYDANTFTPMIALEDLGFCERGEVGEFIASGAIGPEGAIPINTDGGGLSSNHPGRRGIFTVIESVRQLRHCSPGSQLSDPEVALAHGFGGELSSCATLIMGV